MAVTLPCLLLLLDYWPLKRLPPTFAFLGGGQERKIYLRLLIEKLPFFALSFAVSVLTVIAQNSGGAIKSIQQVPFSLRLLNAPVAYAQYVCATIWPVNLCAYYPLPSQIPILQAICAGLVLVAISYLAFKMRHKFPWLIVGWLWFLGTLVPIIGLVQVGKQAMADRYTYIPSIGLFIMVTWSIAYWFKSKPSARIFGFGVTGVILFACLVSARGQLAYWHDSITLFTRAVSVTQNNAVAENNLGVALSNAGRGHEAISHYQAVLSIQPNDVKAHYNLGIEFASEGKPAAAEFHFSQALKYNPRSEKLHNNLGVVLAQQGKSDLAIDQFKQAIQLNPIYPNPYLNLGMILQNQGKIEEAVTNYKQALNLEPEWPQALDKLAFLTATCCGTKWYNPSEAVKLAKHANEITGYEFPSYLETLALSYAAAGEFSNAVITAEKAKTSALKSGFAELAGKLDKDLKSYRLGKIPQISSTNSSTFGIEH
jgi:Flp pilus assembly protein TadD